MPKLTVDARPREEVSFQKIKTRVNEQPIIPTGDHRHVATIREGKQSAEIWSRKQRERWHEDYDGPPIYGTVKEAVKNASKPVPEGSAEGATSDEKNIRKQKGKASVLRNSKQEGQGEEQKRQSEKRVQKTKALKRTAQKRVDK